MIYAGFWRRFAAVIIDFLILLIPALVVGWVLPYVGNVAVALLYFPVFESSKAQTTPGKYVMGMKVLHENGATLSFWRAVARYLMKYVSAFLFCVGYIMQVFTVKRQALHDMVAGAIIVRHDFNESPDWVEAWLQQMRHIFRAETEEDSKKNSTSDMYESPITQGPQDIPEMEKADSSQASSSASVNPTSAMESIERLHVLYKQGALSEEEYQTKKSSFLKQI